MSARTRYEAGTEALQKKRYAEAALHFEAAATLNPHAASWFMASVAWQEAFRPERAADALARAIAVGGLEAAALEHANSDLAKLETTLGTVDVTAPAGWRVQMEGAPLAEVPARVHALPGTHSLRVVPLERPIFDRSVVLAAGNVVTLALSARDAEQEASTPAPVVERVVVRTEAPPGQLRKTLGAAAFGIAGATAVAAIVLGVSALDARDAYRVSRTQGEFDHVRYLEGWTNAAWVGALVFAAGGAALFFWPTPAEKPKEPARGASLGIGPSGASVTGSF